MLSAMSFLEVSVLRVDNYSLSSKSPGVEGSRKD